MPDVITSATVRENREIPPFSPISGNFIEYKFKTRFRETSEVLGRTKVVSITVKQLGREARSPIEVTMIRPGTDDEVVLQKVEFPTLNAPGPSGPTFSARQAGFIASTSSDTRGVQFTARRKIDIRPRIPDFDDILIDNPDPGGGGGHIPPPDFELYRYEIQDDDPNGEWTFRVKNKGPNTEVFTIDIRHPDMQLALSESRIPFSLLNRILAKVKTLMGIEVRLDRDATIDFRPEFKRLTGLDEQSFHLGIVGEIPFFGNDVRLRDINLESFDFNLAGRGGDSLVFSASAKFETSGATELDVNNGFDIGLNKLEFDFEALFNGSAGFVYDETRNLAGEIVEASAPAGKVTLEAKVDVESTSFEGQVRDRFEKKLIQFIHSKSTKDALNTIAQHFTEILMFLAEGDRPRVFFDIRTTSDDIIVRHYATPSERLRDLPFLDIAVPPVIFVPGVSSSGDASSSRSPGSPTAPRFSVADRMAELNLVATTGELTTVRSAAADASYRRIEHIVVLMLENRSFDHMLGYLTMNKNRDDVEGLDAPANHTNTVPGSSIVRPIFPLTDGKAVLVDPGHHVDDVLEQVAGGEMSGFVANYMRKSGIVRSPGDDKLVMGFYDENFMTVFDALAEEYVVCDHWFCSHPGPTYPNRFISLMGSTPSPENLDIGGNEAGTVKGDTIFDVLTEAGVSWNYVESNIAFLRMFDKYRVDEENIIQFEDWRKMAEAGQLPAVSWVDPNFGDLELDGAANDDHPPANVLKGQAVVQRVYEALTSDPIQWSKTLFIITYDEHGGFYDHVTPHGLNDSDDGPVVHKIHEDGQEFYGPRVPAFVVSPRVAKRTCSKTVFEHTSVLKTILVNFLGEDSIGHELLGKRVDAANSLLDLLEDQARSDISSIPKPPAGEDARDVSFPIERGSFHLGIRLFGFGRTLKQLAAQHADE